MRSIHITSNDSKVISGINSDEFSLSFLVSLSRRKGKEICTLHLTGVDLDANIDYKWLGEEIVPEGEIIINFGENEDSKISVPQQRTENQSDDFVIEQKLKAYKRLKLELEEKGII